MKFRIIQDLRANQLSRLLPAFKEAGAEVDVKNMERTLKVNISPQTAAPLAACSGDVMVVDSKQGKAAEQQVAICAALETTVFTETRMEAQFIRYESCLIFLG